MTKVTRQQWWRRRSSIVVMSCLVSVAVTACGSAKAGVVLPNGDSAATYVSAKFTQQLTGLATQFTSNVPRKTVLTKLIRVDEQSSDNTISAVQFGQPPARVSKNQSNRDSGTFLHSFHPAASPVEYLQLGPTYATLAPTPWVSMPYTDNTSECAWTGAQDVCEIIQSVTSSLQKGNAAKNATSHLDGSVELTANVTLGTLLDERLLILEPELLARITDTMKAQTFPTRIVMDSQGKLAEVDLTGVIRDNEHEVEVKMNYRLDSEPSANDLPKVPDPSQITALADKTAVDDFYQRLHQIQAGR